MRLIDSLRFRIATLFRRTNINADMEEELRAHMEHRADDLERSGLARAEAERRARIEFGAYERYRHKSHEAAGGVMIDSLYRDMVFASRSAKRAPLLTCIAIVALAIGIGLNAGVFSLLNVVLFQPPVSKDPASFVQFYPSYQGWFNNSDKSSSFTAEDFDALHAQTRTLSSVAAWDEASVTLEDEHKKGTAHFITYDYFTVFGVDSPLKGRFFLPGECQPGTSARVVVLDEFEWKGAFNSDPKIIGKVIHINHQPMTVVGIAPDGSLHDQMPAFYVPYTWEAIYHPANNVFHNADWPWLNVAGRLKPGVTRTSAKAELEGILHQRDRLYVERKISTLDRKTSLLLTNGSVMQRPMFQAAGAMLVGLTLGPLFLVLLLACTNVTVLFLSRSVVRRAETAIRLALGSGRTRLMRMLAFESLFTAALAGGVGIFLAYQVPRLIFMYADPEDGMLFPAIRPDWRVFAYLAVMVLVATLVSALAPMRESFKLDLVTALKGRENAATARSRTTSILIVAQMAMSFVLMIGAVLFARAPYSIMNSDLGFETRQVAIVPLDVETPPYTDASAQTFYRTLETRIRQVPGVQSVAYQSLPFLGQAPPQEILIPGQAKGKGRPATVNNVSDNFFQAFGVPVMRGRSFQQTDISNSGPAAVAIISEAMANVFWSANEDPIGKAIITPDGKRLTVIGVARDMRVEHLGETDSPRLYTLRNPASTDGTLYVRFSGDSVAVTRSIEAIIKQLDPNQLVNAPETLRKFIEESATEVQTISNIIVFMAAIAMAMAIIGLYGVLTFAINQRRREFGIQMVLGATRQTVFRVVMVRGLRQISLGLFFGAIIALPVAMLLRRLFSKSMIQVNPFDPLLYITAAAILVIVSCVAMYLPAFRATQVDPMQALRNE